jgi:CPA2 family monovalent cation:H+ antiporter-2
VLHAENLKGLIIFLVVAGIIVPLFHRARIGTVLGFLIAGAALGPHGLAHLTPDYPWLRYITFDNPERAEVLAEFGIVVLLFLLGLELSLQRLWQLRRYVLGVGLAQVALTTLAIGFAVRLSGAVPPAGLVLGLCLALSSTAIVMQLLAEQHRAHDQVGRLALSVLLFQDLMVVPILFVVGILAGTEGPTGPGILGLAKLFALALAAVIAILLVGRYLVRPLMHSAVRTGSRDIIMAITLLLLVVCAVVTGLAGLSVALGAFLAGLLLSDSEARHNIEVDLEPFKGLLLGIFFITVGTSIDVMTVAGDIGWIVGALVLLVGIKAGILFAVARGFGVARAPAIEMALLLAQAGEFGFVVIGVAGRGDLLSPRLAAGAAAVVGLSMVVTPLLAGAARRLAARLDSGDHRGDEPSGDPADLNDHIVIGGFGRVGQMVARALDAEGVPYIALDSNGDLVAERRHRGQPVYFGDAGRAELLERVGAERARAVVVTVNNRKAAESMVAAARGINANAVVCARAVDSDHAKRLVTLGAISVIPETLEASLQLVSRILEALELPADGVTERVAEIRAAELAKLTQDEAKA